MSKLLINENPLQVLPKLAEAIGLNEAIFLQQLHYWLTPDPTRNYEPHYLEWEGVEHPWVYNTYESKTTRRGKETGWAANFPFWSARTIMRIVASLKERNLIITTDKYNKLPTDRTLWYTINYEELNRLEVATLSTSTMPNCQSQEDDNLADSGEGQDGNLLPETPSEDSTETSSENGGAAEKTPPPDIDFASLGQRDPLDGVPMATDSHQQAVDKANGGDEQNPVNLITKAYYSGYMGGPIPFPTGKKERKRWQSIGQRLTDRFPPEILKDIATICYWIERWHHSDIDNFWKDKPEADTTLDNCAKYVVNHLRDRSELSTKPPDLPKSDPLSSWWRDQLRPPSMLAQYLPHLRGSTLLSRDNGEIVVMVQSPVARSHLNREPVQEAIKTILGLERFEIVAPEGIAAQ